MTTDRNSEGWQQVSLHSTVTIPEPATVPAAEVQALVERWRHNAKHFADEDEAAVANSCADELAKLIPRGK